MSYSDHTVQQTATTQHSINDAITLCNNFIFILLDYCKHSIKAAAAKTSTTKH